MRSLSEQDTVEAGLLTAGDPAAVEVVNKGGASRVVLLCEHAGRAVPRKLASLGLMRAQFDRHIAVDIGAEGLARGLSALLDAPLVLQRYSRLVVDCNRPPDAPDLIPEVSDGTPIPANVGLPRKDRDARIAALHRPFHARVTALLDAHPAQGRAVVVAVHSFTPKLVTEGIARPWHVGLLFNRDDRFSRRLMTGLLARRPNLPSAFNQPYSVSDRGDYAIPVHGEARGLNHTLIEVRNDLIATPDWQADWAAFLGAAIRDALDR